MIYIVKIQTTCGQKKVLSFPTYRESLCHATDYRLVKISKVFKNGVLINEFRF